VTTSSLLPVLLAFHREKLALRQRHVAVARQVGDYAFNNTYQYVIAREDTHLAWVEAAIAEAGGTPDVVDEPVLPSVSRPGSTGFLALVGEDARAVDAFVASWRPRLSEVSNARHQKLLDVVLGETLEHKRFFDLMVAGRDDLLGRRANGPGSPGTGDGVMAVRWIE
jgi:hypothetical protein